MVMVVTVMMVLRVLLMVMRIVVLNGNGDGCFV